MDDIPLTAQRWITGLGSYRVRTADSDELVADCATQEIAVRIVVYHGRFLAAINPGPSAKPDATGERLVF